MSTEITRKADMQAHILLLDHNKMGLCARKSVLEEQGYRITAFADAEDALEAFSSSPFDVVIMDYKMPGMNGIEFISRIREQKPESLTILISGFADALGLNEVSTGADVVIQKSNHEITNLVRSVQRLLSRKAPRKPAAIQSASLKARRKFVYS
jgi:CheY-like chemotaxis protein